MIAAIRLWQKRFWEHTVRDDGDFERCADYIHFNPVKHRLVTSPGSWPFSSLHHYVRAGELPADWVCDVAAMRILGAADDGDGACESRVARRSTRATRPDL